MGLFVVFFVPETKGVELENMGKLFQSFKATSFRKRMAM
jgi:hypothetical protein